MRWPIGDLAPFRTKVHLPATLTQLTPGALDAAPLAAPVTSTASTLASSASSSSSEVTGAGAGAGADSTAGAPSSYSSSSSSDETAPATTAAAERSVTGDVVPLRSLNTITAAFTDFTPAALDSVPSNVSDLRVANHERWIREDTVVRTLLDGAAVDFERSTLTQYSISTVPHNALGQQRVGAAD